MLPRRSPKTPDNCWPSTMNVEGGGGSEHIASKCFLSLQNIYILITLFVYILYFYHAAVCL